MATSRIEPRFFSMIEAIVLAIRTKFPDIREVTFARSFTRFIHTETQDGKSVLDAHFAHSMQVVLSWCKEKHNCITPTQLVAAVINLSPYYMPFMYVTLSQPFTSEPCPQQPLMTPTQPV